MCAENVIFGAIRKASFRIVLGFPPREVGSSARSKKEPTFEIELVVRCSEVQ